MKSLSFIISLAMVFLLSSGFKNPSKMYPVWNGSDAEYIPDAGQHIFALFVGYVDFSEPIKVEYYVTVHYKQSGIDHIEMFYIEPDGRQSGESEYYFDEEVPYGSPDWTDLYITATGPVFKPL